MKTQRAERLRTTVDFLPPDTKRAMLAGLERNRIITGANTDRRGGMCPMIAADRNAFESGPMADIFAAVWDSYNGACILNRRDASERDLRTLKTMLEESAALATKFQRAAEAVEVGEALTFLRGKIQVNDVSEANRALFAEKMRPVYMSEAMIAIVEDECGRAGPRHRTDRHR